MIYMKFVTKVIVLGIPIIISCVNRNTISPESCKLLSNSVIIYEVL